MMFVLAFHPDIQVHTGRIAQRFEKMHHHFSRKIAYILALEFSLKHQPRPASKIERYRTQAVIHWQGKAIPFNASLIAQ